MRLQFRVWDKKKEEMKYSGFVIRDGNPACKDKQYVEIMSKHGLEVPKRETGTMGAEPLETPNEKQALKINKIMEDESAYYGLIDWSNWYGVENYVTMQCTGFHDKAGNLIFEDDILTDGEIESIVEWHYGCFVWNGQMIADYDRGFQGDKLGMDSKSLFIVGNKWERNKGQQKLELYNERN